MKKKKDEAIGSEEIVALQEPEMVEPVAIPGLDLEKKIAAIEASALPDSQKREYLKSLGIGVEKESGVPFSVYCKARKIEASRHAAMLAFPKAKGVRLASLEKWDEIFKDF
jgi:hypothetical protein